MWNPIQAIGEWLEGIKKPPVATSPPQLKVVADTDRFSDKEILARTIYGEARNQPSLGKQAVACVVMNRVKRGGWWGDTVRAVCLAPEQFSCWNQNDVNRHIIMSVLDGDPVFTECLSVAQLAMDCTLLDPTHGADSYVVKGLVTKWSRGLAPIAVIGAHEFFKIGLS